jgi:hypothetical protein
MSDDTLKKIIVTIAALASLLVWGFRELSGSDDCTYNCVTEFSAQRR